MIREWPVFPVVGKMFFCASLVVALAGCSTNPATGERQFAALMSPAQENQVGAQEHQKVLKTYGIPDNSQRIQAYVEQVGQSVARDTERPEVQYKFTLLDSPMVNAFAIPGGYIYVTRGLMALANNEAEFAGVLAHEIGHYKKRHILTGMLISIAHMGIIFFLMSLFIRLAGLHEAFGMEQISLYAGLLFFGLLYSPVEMLLGPLMNLLSRRHEFEADRFAAGTSGLGEALITALKKLSRDNLSHLTPHPFQVFLHHSHPPVLKRIESIRMHHSGAV